MPNQDRGTVSSSRLSDAISHRTVLTDWTSLNLQNRMGKLDPVNGEFSDGIKG